VELKLLSADPTLPYNQLLLKSSGRCEEMFVVLWIVFSFAVAIAANANGRSGCGWFFISLLISPLFAILLVIAVPSKNE
jgi:hypothetical protein